MTEILEEIQKEKIAKTVPEFVGYINRRRSSISFRRSSIGLSEGLGSGNSDASTSEGVDADGDGRLGRSSKFRNNSLLVLQSIGFLKRNAGKYEDDGLNSLRSLSIDRHNFVGMKTDFAAKFQRRKNDRRGSVFHAAEANDYIEMPSDVWNTVKLGLLNEGFEKYTEIVLQKLKTRNDFLINDEPYPDSKLSLSAEKRYGIKNEVRRSSMREYINEPHAIPHFLVSYLSS